MRSHVLPSSSGPEQQPPFTAEIARGDGATVIRASGELDMATVDALSGRIEEAMRDTGGIGLDMTGVEFMDSTGLRTLIVAREKASAAGRDFWVVPSEAVKKLITLAGLTDFIPMRSGNSGDTRAA
jgi:anti-sigma B factor antagonist